MLSLTPRFSEVVGDAPGHGSRFNGFRGVRETVKTVEGALLSGASPR
jgi:hypothetical protein